MLLGSLLSLALPLATLGASYGGATYNNQELAKRQSAEVELHKRFSNSRWTYYNVGVTACGVVANNNDFVVALSAAQFGSGNPGPNCNKIIHMTYNGKTAQARVVDKCIACSNGDLDLSPGLFSFFAPLSVGLIYGEWNFV